MHAVVMFSSFALFWWGCRRRLSLGALPSLFLLALLMVLFGDRIRVGASTLLLFNYRDHREEEQLEAQQQDEAFEQEDAETVENEQAMEQWLRRIPDDPGGLLRRKFFYQYRQLPNQAEAKEPW